MNAKDVGTIFGAALLVAIGASAACQTGSGSVADEAQSKIDQATDSGEEAAEGEYGEEPSRIILFIGDGMGVPAVTASSYAMGEPLAMLNMAEFGMMATHEHEFVTTDSAASATAKATGEKTHFNAVSVEPSTGPNEEQDPDRQLRTVVEAAQEADWKTGLVATVRINHATPAPFAAHRHARHSYEDIALDMSRSGVDVLMGAGSDYFVDREDGRNLLDEMKDRGYTVEDDARGVRRAAGEASRLVGLMHDRDMPWVEEGDRKMELNEMLEHSLRVLERDDPEGFFLMVEGSKIDWAGHRMDGRRVVDETVDMDRAVRDALEYARDRSDTLVVVTSDHETGDMDVIDGPTADRYLDRLEGDDREVADRTKPGGLSESERGELSGPFARLDSGDGAFGPEPGAEIVPTFGYLSAASRADWDGAGRFSAVHTPHLVPIFAEGAGAERAASVRDNADLGRQLMGWIDERTPEIEAARTPEATETEQEPENVILLVADGLGMASLTASYYHFGVPSVLEMPHTGVVSTHGADRLVNDAAGSSTALATGARTRRGAVGMAPGTEGGGLEARTSALVQAAGTGRSTGLVSTSDITAPTPAAFYADRPDSDDRSGIAGDFTRFHDGELQMDFVAAVHDEHLGDDHLRQLEERGVSIHSDWDETGGKPAHYLVEDGDRPRLAEMSQRATEVLSEDDDGFLLVVDADGLGEAKAGLERGAGLTGELEEWNETSRRLIDFVREDEKTLLVVTSLRDHTLGVVDNHYGFDGDGCAAAARCGGDFEMEWLDVATGEIRHGQGLEDEALQGEFAPPEIGLQYTWLAQYSARTADIRAPFSANFVPLFAEGPGAGEFGGFVDQPDVGRRLMQWARGAPSE